MERTKSKIAEIKKNGYDLNFDPTFSFAFNLYHKIALNAGLVMLMLGIAVFIIVMVIIFSVIGIDNLSHPANRFDPNNLTGLYLVLYIFGTAIYTAIIGVLSAGILKMVHCADIKEDFSIGTAFDYFNSKYFKELFLGLALLTIVSATQSTLFSMLGVEFIGIIISIILAILTSIVIPLIVFGNLKAIDAIFGSIIVISKNFLMVFVLIIVAYILSLAGIIACGVGMFFTIPFISAMHYSIYVHSVGVEKNNSETLEIPQSEH